MSKEESDADKTRLMFSGLLGVSIVAVVQIVGRTELDFPLLVSLYSFAVAIPFLAALVWIIMVTETVPGGNAWYYGFLAAIGSLGSLFGIGAIFWHFSKAIGAVFVVCSLLGVCVFIAFTGRVERAKISGDA